MHNSINNSDHKNMLPIQFTPGIDHVIIEKGKKYASHSGNLRLRQLVLAKLDKYATATSKIQKSQIIWDVIGIVRSSSSDKGGFIKQDKQSGRWYYAEDVLARERVSQVFRDALYLHYKSSRQNRRKGNPKRGAPSSNKVTQEDGHSNECRMRSSLSWAEDADENELFCSFSTTSRSQQHIVRDDSSSADLMFYTLNSPSWKANRASTLSSHHSTFPVQTSGTDLYQRLSQLLSQSILERNDDPFEPVPIRPSHPDRLDMLTFFDTLPTEARLLSFCTNNS